MDRQQADAPQTQDITAYTDAILHRLVEHYLADSPLPGDNGELSITLFHRLYRNVMMEGYGDEQAG